jgi:CubicO group peptidase (beta-lactamase class C family)
MRQRLAVGHDASLKPVPNWDMPVLAGAGALRSSVNDMLTFLAANLGYVDSLLESAMSSMLLVRRPTGTPRLETALGWLVSHSPDGLLVWHNGGTGGYRSYDLQNMVVWQVHIFRG